MSANCAVHHRLHVCIPILIIIIILSGLCSWAVSRCVTIEELCFRPGRRLTSGGACVDIPVLLLYRSPLELRSGRRLCSPTPVMAQTTASTAATTSAPPAGPIWSVTAPQRDPQVFSGLRGEDVEDWLDQYDRVSACNHWDESHKLRYVAFYLGQVAQTWFFNHERDFPDWPAFTAQLRQIFGTSAGRSEVAKQKLATRIQGADESYISYVLALCRRAQSDMSGYHPDMSSFLYPEGYQLRCL